MSEKQPMVVVCGNCGNQMADEGRLALVVRPEYVDLSPYSIHRFACHTPDCGTEAHIEVDDL